MCTKAMSSAVCCLSKWVLADVFDRQQTDRAKPVNEEMRSIFECHCEVHDIMSLADTDIRRKKHGDVSRHDIIIGNTNFTERVTYEESIFDCLRQFWNR